MKWIVRHIRLPVVTNNKGAMNVGPNAATLQGLVVRHGGENPSVCIYWGREDGTTDPEAWEYQENLGVKGIGRVSYRVEGLDPDTAYYYRVYASNSAGANWAPESSMFTTPDATPAQVSQTPKDDLLAQVRRMRDYFGQGQGGSGLDIRIPSSGVDPRDLRLEDWDTIARQMAEAERSAVAGARVARELLGVAGDIKKAQERAQKEFRAEARRAQEAYQLLGLEPPEIRTEEDLLAATELLEKKLPVASGEQSLSEQSSEVAESPEEADQAMPKAIGNGGEVPPPHAPVDLR